MEVETAIIEIETTTDQPDIMSYFKKALIKLLADPNIRSQLYEAIQTEEALRESRANTYK